MISTLKTPSPAVDRAISILGTLAESETRVTLPKLRQQLGLPKSSAHCLLVAFERSGYLHRQDRTGPYMFGLKLFGLANMAPNGLDIRRSAAPHLRLLSCVGAPVFGRSGAVVAAISVAGTTSQIAPDNEAELAGEVKQTAAAISAQLGYRPPATEPPAATNDGNAG